MLVDEKSRMMFSSILSKKSEKYVTWCDQVMAETGKAINEFHCDGGTEFISHRLIHYFNDKGIKRTITTKELLSTIVLWSEATEQLMKWPPLCCIMQSYH